MLVTSMIVFECILELCEKESPGSNWLKLDKINTKTFP